MYNLRYVPALVLCTVLVGCSRGNYPESRQCANGMVQVFCTHPSHSLDGWRGACYPSEQDAGREIDHHAKDYHQGQLRWTGVIDYRD